MSQEREKNHVSELISSLQQQRDELALHMQLAKMEAKEEFEKAQEKLDQVSSDFAPLKDAVEASAENVWESLKLVAGEVKNSFDRIRKTL